MWIEKVMELFNRFILVLQFIFTICLFIVWPSFLWELPILLFKSLWNIFKILFL